MGISICTTRARDRALIKPMKVIVKASMGTEAADHAEKFEIMRVGNSVENTLINTNKTSRKKVNTNSDEKSPIVSNHSQANKSDKGWRLMKRASMPSGMSKLEMASKTIPAK